MYRYLALLWDHTCQAHTTRARQLARLIQNASTEWSYALDTRRMLVLHTSQGRESRQDHALADESGVVLGSVFTWPSEDDARPIDSPERIDADTSRRIVATDGRHLSKSFWGSYVAFLEDETAQSLRVLRSPGGSLPCLLTVHEGLHVVFSYPQDLRLLGMRHFEIDWEYVAGYVAYCGAATSATGLKSVSELLPGECVELSAGRSRRSLYWQPAEVVRGKRQENPAAAARALRTTVEQCIGAWTSRHRRVLHTLSGGLDSSIVLGCLRRAASQPKVTCVNYVADAPEGDERAFARLAAESAACELLEVARVPETTRLDPMMQIVPFVRPWNYRYALENHQNEARMAESIGASAIFSGGGGDQILYQCRAELAVADDLKLRGLHPRVFRTAWDAARVERLSIWPVLRQGVKLVYGRTPWNRFADVSRFRTLLHPDFSASLASRQPPSHPWFDDIAGIPRGKLWQIQMISAPPLFYSPICNPPRLERLYPFMMSQPITELCLRIPTYVLIHGGWDRSIARAAFRDCLPRAIVTRRTKGQVSRDIARIYRANLEFIRRMLLDGILVREKILSRQSLERVLSPDHTLLARETGEVGEHLSTEIWLRRWEEPAASRAAA